MLNALFDRVSAFLLYHLGKLLNAKGMPLAAQYCHAAAYSLNPRNPQSLYEDANARWLAGDPLSARVLLESLLKFDSRHARGKNLLGAIYLAASDLGAAEKLFREAIDLDPVFSAAHNNLGNVFVERDDCREAQSHYLSALACDPDYVEAINNLGMTLNRLGNYIEAEKYFRRALQLRPQYAGALNNLGNALLNQDRRGEATECYRAALRLQSNLAEARLNLAITLDDPSQLAETIEHYRLELERKPRSYVAHLRLSMALQAKGDWVGSERHLQAAESICPTALEAPTLRGNNALYLGDFRRADDQFRRALLLGAGSAVASSLLFNRLYDPDCGPAEIFRSAREWAVMYAESIFPIRLSTPVDKKPRRLRIGYLSGDFALHSVAYFIEPILTHHDSERFEVFCYSNNSRPDGQTEVIESLSEHWRDIAFDSDEKAFKKIISDDIDVLVELSGHTTGNRLRLLARNPAPVQVSYLGYPATTGLRAIDYRLVDAITDPPSVGDAVHSEILTRLPGCFLTYQPPRESPPVSASPGAWRGYVTFGSFNNPLKTNEEVIAAWARILHAVPGSRLMLKGISFASECAVARLRQMFATKGVGAERLILLARHPEIRGHLELYGELDIALDTFPYNGTTTTCEALWMGVPVLTLAGDRHSARVGASLLASVGFPELVSRSVEEYVEAAVRLASDLGRLALLRNELRERMRASPLLDAGSFTRKLEAAYDAMWRRYLDKQAAHPNRAASAKPDE